MYICNRQKYTAAKRDLTYGLFGPCLGAAAANVNLGFQALSSRAAAHGRGQLFFLFRTGRGKKNAGDRECFRQHTLFQIVSAGRTSLSKITFRVTTLRASVPERVFESSFFTELVRQDYTCVPYWLCVRPVANFTLANLFPSLHTDQLSVGNWRIAWLATRRTFLFNDNTAFSISSNICKLVRA